MAYDKILTYSKEIKNELGNKDWPFTEYKPLLAGLFHLAGKVYEDRLEVRTELATLAKMTYKMLRQAFKVEAKIDHSSKSKFSSRTIYCVYTTSDIQRISQELKLDQDFSRTNNFLGARTIRPYVAGLFLASGSISNPHTGDYYLEIRFNNEEEARTVASKIEAFGTERRMGFKVIERRNKYIMYLKKSEEIANFLAFIKASIAMLNFENTRLTRDYYNSENRLDVCLAANYSRSLKTGEKNLEDINIIKNKIGLETQDEKTRVIIGLRERYVDASYQELANYALNEGIVTSKSSISHIFKALSELAKRIK